MGFNEFIGKLFGNKNTRDMREIQPWVEKAKQAYAVVVSGETAKYGNIILKKGVTPIA